MIKLFSIKIDLALINRQRSIFHKNPTKQPTVDRMLQFVNAYKKQRGRYSIGKESNELAKQVDLTPK